MGAPWGEMLQQLRNYWCLQELLLPLFPGAIVLWRASNPCFGSAWLGDALWGSQLLFQPGRFILMLLPSIPVYYFGKGFPEGQLSGWRGHWCPLSGERTES